MRGVMNGLLWLSSAQGRDAAREAPSPPNLEISYQVSSSLIHREKVELTPQCFSQIQQISVLTASRMWTSSLGDLPA